MRRGLQSLRERVEADVIRHLAHGKTAHENASDAIGAFGVLVLPGPRIARARRQDVDIMTLAHMLSEKPGCMFDTRTDVGTVAWRDEREFQ
jgi:hypothetical protein